jgi:hypothetical protein
MRNSTLHADDFHAWTEEQAALLRAGRVAEADIAHIAEEIESLGRAEKRELLSRLVILILHLLKWQHQPFHRGASWRVSIANTRDELAAHLEDNPSLAPQIPLAIETAYRRARRHAAAETGLDEAAFPAACPWDYAQMMDETFWPAL